MKFRSIAAALALGLLLPACNSDAPGEESKAEADRNAKGEVVGGTISDAMLPLDSLRSQSPPMKVAPKPGDAAAADADGDADPAAVPEVETAQDEPAATGAESAPEPEAPAD